MFVFYIMINIDYFFGGLLEKFSDFFVFVYK